MKVQLSIAGDPRQHTSALEASVWLMNGSCRYLSDSLRMLGKRPSVQARRGILYWVTSPNGSGEEARDGEQLPASRLHFYTLYFFQESVVFLNNGALKSTLAPAQRIAGIISYWGMEMLFPAPLDEFNHIIDGHSNLLSDVDAAATIESSPTL
jgi:hypothetical protein